MTARILVTGASGFAGSHLLERLSDTGELFAWTRAQHPPRLRADAHWQHVDVMDRAVVRAALEIARPTEVYHLAGSPHVAASWRDTAAPLAHNVIGTHHLLDNLRRLGHACRVLVTGSASVYAASRLPIDEQQQTAPTSPYALSKYAQERLAIRSREEDGLNVIVTRSFNHTGPRQTPAFVAPSIARQIARIEHGLDDVLKVGNLDATRDFTDVRDVAGAYVALMARSTPEGTYNVASGTGRPMHEILDALVARARVPIQVVSDPERMRPHDTPAVVGDASKLRTTTGWVPVIGFEQMMDDLLDYWRTIVAEDPAA